MSRSGAICRTRWPFAETPSEAASMLLDLEIRDFAIIDDLRIQFGTGAECADR